MYVKLGREENVEAHEPPWHQEVNETSNKNK